MGCEHFLEYNDLTDRAAFLVSSGLHLFQGVCWCETVTCRKLVRAVDF